MAQARASKGWFTTRQVFIQVLAQEAPQGALAFTEPLPPPGRGNQHAQEETAQGGLVPASEREPYHAEAEEVQAIRGTKPRATCGGQTLEEHSQLGGHGRHGGPCSPGFITVPRT